MGLKGEVKVFFVYKKVVYLYELTIYSLKLSAGKGANFRVKKINA